VQQVENIEKESKRLNELSNLLKNRGLKNRNNLDLDDVIFSNGYFRLNGYLRYFESLEGKNKIFTCDTDLFDIVKIYELDSELRSLILKAEEIFEIAFRARFSYFFSVFFDPYSYLIKSIYKLSKNKNKSFAEELVREIKKWISVSKEPCILFYKRKKVRIPIWVVIEILPFNTISKMFGLLDNFNCNKAITRSFNITNHNNDFAQIVKTFVILRNICAHHGRLWNRKLQTYPSLPKQFEKEAIEYSRESIMGVLVLLTEAIRIIKRNTLLPDSIFELINSDLRFKAGICKPEKHSF
jgi:abortive infection bacteriophage resistance protein